ncbi:two-component sensor histidine kinase [Actinophytocola xinjiangensis]|uniref:Two-component sensor histidine kinase n=1 Tax=Actinophytocola xinjiangensis TaxID=485602 RepID=A0A7Z0WLA9_9PSEU|nr:sensor histidine kinase [Actinophytocola xinjiangensis]OLF10108.1 two-component sensor histidine kinase [Actinophytocola xinjiangensis]
MSEPDLAAEFDRWERRESAIIGVLPYFLVAVSSVIALMQPAWGMPDHSAGIIPLVGVAVAWIAWLYTAHPGWRSRRRLMAGYFTGLMLICGGLVILSPWFGILAFIGYIHSMETLAGRWRFVGVAATAFLAGSSQVGGVANINADTWWVWLLVVVFNMLVAGAFSFFGEQTQGRNLWQKRALAELEAALEENAGLHTQLLTQAREAGVLDERQRMAREIHDTLAQGLAGIITQLHAAQQSPADWRRHVDTAAALARDSLTEARRTVHAVEPAALESARLPDAIGEVVTRWASVNDVRAVLTTTGHARPMHPEVEVTLLRAAQEALANVAKHARASRVGLTLSYMEDLVTLDVRDDGIGFASPGVRSDGMRGGFGLTGMRQRVQRLAGRLEIESEPGGGTAVSATVPAIPAGGAP